MDTDTHPGRCHVEMKSRTWGCQRCPQTTGSFRRSGLALPGSGLFSPRRGNEALRLNHLVRSSIGAALESPHCPAPGHLSFPTCTNLFGLGTMGERHRSAFVKRRRDQPNAAELPQALPSALSPTCSPSTVPYTPARWCGTRLWWGDCRRLGMDGGDSRRVTPSGTWPDAT